MDTYNSQLSGAEVAKASRQFRESRVATGSIAPVGWGDGGGGTTREMTGTGRRLADLEGSATVRWEHPDDVLRPGAVRAAAPAGVGRRALPRAAPGDADRPAPTKQGNRRSEHLLIEAELWAATAAARTGFAYPYDELDALWQQVLLQQFHDILPGTSIAWVHREAVEQYAEISRGAEAIIAARSRRSPATGDAAVVVNPAPVPPGRRARAGRRRSRPTWRRRPPCPLTERGRRVRARERPGAGSSSTRRGSSPRAVDLASGRDAIAPGQVANLLQLHQDFPNMWDAWDVDRYYRNRVDGPASTSPR